MPAVSTWLLLGADVLAYAYRLRGESDYLERAASLYENAANQGNALAMHNLAVLHTSGLLGGKPDMEAAVDWFIRAASLGVKDSQVNLGILHTRGMGVETDLVEAWKWFEIAARAGDADAAQKRDTLSSALNAEQLDKAKALAAQWKPEPLDAAANVVVDRPEWTETPVRSSMLQHPVIQFPPGAQCRQHRHP